MTKAGPIVNMSDVPLEPQGNGKSFQAQVARVGKALGSEMLGCTLVVVPPGHKAWPYHLQHANEEMFVILEGNGTLRYDGEEYALKAGDVISAKTGPGTAHQIINSSDAELRYLAMSTMIHPEVAEYPDSGKRAMLTGSPPGRAPYDLFEIVPNGTGVSYWEGEE